MTESGRCRTKKPINAQLIFPNDIKLIIPDKLQLNHAGENFIYFLQHIFLQGLALLG